jgi:hypothetical protein
MRSWRAFDDTAAHSAAFSKFHCRHAVRITTIAGKQSHCRHVPPVAATLGQIATSGRHFALRLVRDALARTPWPPSIRGGGLDAVTRKDEQRLWRRLPSWNASPTCATNYGSVLARLIAGGPQSDQQW